MITNKKISAQYEDNQATDKKNYSEQKIKKK